MPDLSGALVPCQGNCRIGWWAFWRCWTCRGLGEAVAGFRLVGGLGWFVCLVGCCFVGLGWLVGLLVGWAGLVKNWLILGY